ncbi:MAG TPA: hypothetical protein VHE30_01240 [Polyangiaceae bacterium]|nr:hypothetical protein [Polyangiaceae bacterium]
MMDTDAGSPVADTKPLAGKVTFASVMALVASLGGNVFQWQKNDAELSKLQAETNALVQEQKENATKSVQSWIEQLQKFDTVEDRVMVLSAALSTSPYDSVKSWAREQMLRLESDLDARKEEAKQQLALATATATTTTPAAGAPTTGEGIGLGSPGTIGHGAGTGNGQGMTRPPTKPTKPSTGGPSPATAEIAEATAKQAFDRVNLADAMLKAAKAKDAAAPPVKAAAPP